MADEGRIVTSNGLILARYAHDGRIGAHPDCCECDPPPPPRCGCCANEAPSAIALTITLSSALCTSACSALSGTYILPWIGFSDGNCLWELDEEIDLDCPSWEYNSFRYYRVYMAFTTGAATLGYAYCLRAIVQFFAQHNTSYVGEYGVYEKPPPGVPIDCAEMNNEPLGYRLGYEYGCRLPMTIYASAS